MSLFLKGILISTFTIFILVSCDKKTCHTCVEGSICNSSGECEPTNTLCKAKTKRCNSNNIEACKDDGSAWELVSSCEENICNAETFVCDVAEDKTAPTVGASGLITAENIKSTSLTLNWSLATDNFNSKKNSNIKYTFQQVITSQALKTANLRGQLLLQL